MEPCSDRSDEADGDAARSLVLSHHHAIHPAGDGQDGVCACGRPLRLPHRASLVARSGARSWALFYFGPVGASQTVTDPVHRLVAPCHPVPGLSSELCCPQIAPNGLGGLSASRKYEVRRRRFSRTGRAPAVGKCRATPSGCHPLPAPPAAAYLGCLNRRGGLSYGRSCVRTCVHAGRCAPRGRGYGICGVV